MSSPSDPSDHAQSKPAQIQSGLKGTEDFQGALNAFSFPLTFKEIFYKAQLGFDVQDDDFSSTIKFTNGPKFGFVANSYSYRPRHRYGEKIIAQHTSQCPGADPPVIYQMVMFNASKDANESDPVVTYHGDRPFQFATRARNQTTQIDTTRPDKGTIKDEDDYIPEAQLEDPSAKLAGPVLEVNFVAKAHFRHTANKIEIIPKTTEGLLLKYTSGQSIVLKSHHLMRALEALVGYYPSFRGTLLAYSYSSKRRECHIRINEPYAVVMHHFKLITSLAEGEYEERHKKDSCNIRLAEVQVNHMKLLYRFAEPLYKANVVPCEQHLSEICPRVAFDMVWYLLKPGTDVYLQSEGITFAGVVVDVAMRYREEADSVISGHSNEEKWWSIKLWCLQTSGTRIRRTLYSSTIDAYSGLRDVTELPVYPVSLWDAKDQGERRKNILESRKAFFKALQQGNVLVYHDGPIRDTNSHYTGKVVLDYRRGVEDFKSALGSFAPVKDHCDQYRHYDSISIKYCQKDTTAIDSNATPASGEKVQMRQSSNEKNQNIFQELTEHQLLLLHPKTPVYELKLKQWMVTSMDYIQEITPSSESISNLVIGEDELQIIRAISQKQNSKTTQWSADFMEGKRSGQIILLHGPPGVGKTYTVEAISEWLHRPLLTITVADIGTNETRFEEQLIEWFDLAEAWNAVLLVDDFDILLEWRRNKNLNRNSLVSAFLRRMECFKGLLFLTTNRVDQIDDVFISQVNVAIEYNHLNAVTRKKVWNMFFEKLERERAGKIQIALDAKKWVLETTEDSQRQLNGRGIRNALQTAITLAEFESERNPDYHSEMVIVVTKDHFQRVLEMSNGFHNYVTGIRPEDERKRAQCRGGS